MKPQQVLHSALFLMLSLTTLTSTANAIDCLDTNGAVLPIDDGRAINWKLSTANQFTARGHVSGIIQALYPNINGHDHFELKIGPNAKDTIEVIYNKGFGPLGNLQTGMTVEACGDYKTSNAPANGYEASPDGAIIHWVHAANNPQNHPGGFLIINGVILGQGHGE